MVGETLNHYEVLEKLGEGGMGHVYLARDTRLHRRVALKILPVELADSNDRIERFEREARAVAALNHPNIVTIFSVEEAKGVRFLTMELVDGKSLDDLIPLGGLELGEFFDLAVPLASAAAAAHAKGIVHRDIKPPNVMVNSEGVVKLLDLGLARLRTAPETDEPSVTEDQTLTPGGRVLGTVPYMAPEQLSGKPIDQRVDVFSLGIVLYQMLTGLRPFQGDSKAEIISSILRDPPPPLIESRPSLPAHLDRVVRKCLRKRPLDRFASAAQLRDELDSLQHLHERGELVVSLREERDRLRTRRRRTHLLLAVGLVLSVAILAGSLFSFEPSGRPAQRTAGIVVRATPSFNPERIAAPEAPLPLPPEPPAGEPAAAQRAARPPAPTPVIEPTRAPVRQPQPAPEVDRRLRLRLSSAVASGVVTLYADDLQIYRRAFEFEEPRRGLLGRLGMRRKATGELADELILPAGADQLRLYLALAGRPARQFVFDSDVLAGPGRLLVTVSEAAEITAEVVPDANGD